ncbi:putative bifunctional diguanylate cyclase/phosphodiesterase [Eubacterium xylanophilum]|uniref:putative bifunctional diguanylate cyclase/phosphodiesterase n=1 Tax=Eubacterium xylanophilum TaxID=39497 RepID=UPI0004AD1A35|nr:EAL domain-containing response regulator [Eubacterium xylanophilum]
MSDILKNVRAKRKVLVVEDERINREILGNLLMSDYDVIYAENGQQALNVLDETAETISLILLDLMMPVMSGEEMLGICKSDPRFSRIPVIIMTQEEDAEVASIRAGADDFITKPYNVPEVILARCERIIDLYEKKRLIDSAETDPLTGLYTRDFFFEYIKQLEKYNDEKMDAIVMDIEHFHLINEIYGRREGDNILKKIATMIMAELGDGYGIASRCTADIFYIFHSCTSDYCTLAERILAELEKVSFENAKIRLRIGVNKNVDRADPPEQWFDHAKLACDGLRGDYTSQIAYYDREAHDRQLYHERLIRDMESSIENKDFVVYYQPKYAIDGEEPVLRSAEALIRWNHPELGMISPGDFIPLFEENGLIQKLDRYVWEEAATQIAQWKERLGVRLPVSVNVSRIDIFAPDLEAKLLNILEKNSLTTSDLLLEITESAYCDSADRLIEVVNSLRNIGFKIEMDDFGSGYSSLNMLTTISVDVLKMDMEFVRNMLKDEKSLKLCELVMDISRFLGVPVVAEGVEEKAQYDRLKSMGCQIIQGYYFSKPLPAQQFEEMF